jgi:ABC-type dipeptide/oligopeptide/nickel transport system ATPase subunit
MLIFGISGPIGSGKTTVAELIVGVSPEISLHLETSTIIIELANAFNAAYLADTIATDPLERTNNAVAELLTMLGLMANRTIYMQDVQLAASEAQQHPEFYNKLMDYLRLVSDTPSLMQSTITAHNKSNYRTLLQWIGGYFLFKIDNTLWYQELYRRIQVTAPQPDIVALTAPRQPAEAEFVRSIGGHVILIDRPSEHYDRSDVTERNVSDITPDCVILNDSDLTGLKKTVLRVYADALAGQLQNRYIASQQA